MLTVAEMKAIMDEAEKEYPFSPQAYVKALTAERQRSKALVEALRKISNISEHKDYRASSETCPACISNTALIAYQNSKPIK